MQMYDNINKWMFEEWKYDELDGWVLNVKQRLFDV